MCRVLPLRRADGICSQHGLGPHPRRVAAPGLRGLRAQRLPLPAHPASHPETWPDLDDVSAHRGVPRPPCPPRHPPRADGVALTLCHAPSRGLFRTQATSPATVRFTDRVLARDRCSPATPTSGRRASAPRPSSAASTGTPRSTATSSSPGWPAPSPPEGQIPESELALGLERYPRGPEEGPHQSPHGPEGHGPPSCGSRVFRADDVFGKDSHERLARPGLRACE